MMPFIALPRPTKTRGGPPHVLPGLFSPPGGVLGPHRALGAGGPAETPLPVFLPAGLASGFGCVGVLGLCLLALRHRDAPSLSLLGVVAALSPTVLYLSWSMNSNGLEMVAGIAFVALCLRL